MGRKFLSDIAAKRARKRSEKSRALADAGQATTFSRCDFMHWAWDGASWRCAFTGLRHDETCPCGEQWDLDRLHP